ncbi:hypothetical protein N2152v2_004630 [Parachlorella kessleri]
MESTVYKGHVLVRQLGSGNFGITKLFRNEETGELVAVKFLKRGRQIYDTVAYVEREILNHRLLSNHPSVVTFKEVFLTPTHLGIAMEFAAGGELFDRIATAGRFPEDVARYFFQQLISGVAWCHSNGVCHRDLKLENSLLDKPIPETAAFNLATLMSSRPRLKICDFGYSKAADIDSQPKSTVGTPAYIAPEVFSRKQYDGKIADVWSCGVTLYVMLVGQYPFEDSEDPRNFNKTIKRIVDVKYSVPYDVRLSRECLDLLGRIFQADPAKRITLQQIQQHPWFLKNLPEELHGGDHFMRDQPQSQEAVAKEEEKIRDIIIAACTLDGQQAEQAKPDIRMQEYEEQYEGNSVDDRYIDAQLGGSDSVLEDELMYMRSTAGAQSWGLHNGLQHRQGTVAAVGTPGHLEPGGAHAGPSGGSMESGVLTGLKAMGISAPGQAQPQRPRGGMHPDLALELGDEFEDDEF